MYHVFTIPSSLHTAILPHDLTGDLSSISGSESSSESDREEGEGGEQEIQLGGSPFVHFMAGGETVYAVYRSVVTSYKV